MSSRFTRPIRKPVLSAYKTKRLHELLGDDFYTVLNGLSIIRIAMDDKFTHVKVSTRVLKHKPTFNVVRQRMNSWTSSFKVKLLFTTKSGKVLQSFSFSSIKRYENCIYNMISTMSEAGELIKKGQ